MVKPIEARGAPADKRWDDLAVAHIDEIAKGLRPREFEKKLVELLDPTLMQAPASASDRRVSVDIAGRKMYSAVALKAHRLKARVGDAVSHLAVRNGCSARCVGDLLGRCKIDGHVENADGETVLDVALNVGAPEDVVACAAEKGFAAAPPGEAAPRPATASLRRPASRSGLSAKALAARNDGDRRRTAPKAPRDRRRFPVPVAESPFHFAEPLHGLTEASEDGLSVVAKGSRDADVPRFACDLLEPRLGPDVSRAAVTFRVRAGARGSDGLYVGLGSQMKGFDIAGGRAACGEPTALVYRLRDGRARLDGKWVPGFNQKGEMADAARGFYDEGDEITLEYDRDTRSLLVRDDRGFSGVLSRNVPYPKSKQPLWFFVDTTYAGNGVAVVPARTSLRLDARSRKHLLQAARNLDSSLADDLSRAKAELDEAKREAAVLREKLAARAAVFGDDAPGHSRASGAAPRAAPPRRPSPSRRNWPTTSRRSAASRAPRTRGPRRREAVEHRVLEKRHDSAAFTAPAAKWLDASQDRKREREGFGVPPVFSEFQAAALRDFAGAADCRLLALRRALDDVRAAAYDAGVAADLRKRIREETRATARSRCWRIASPWRGRGPRRALNETAATYAYLCAQLARHAAWPGLRRRLAELAAPPGPRNRSWRQNSRAPRSSWRRRPARRRLRGDLRAGAPAGRGPAKAALDVALRNVAEAVDGAASSAEPLKPLRRVPGEFPVVDARDGFAEAAAGYRDVGLYVDVGGHVCEVRVAFASLADVRDRSLAADGTLAATDYFAPEHRQFVGTQASFAKRAAARVDGDASRPRAAPARLGAGQILDCLDLLLAPGIVKNLAPCLTSLKLARCAGDLGAVPRTLGALRELKVLHIVGASPVEKLQLVGQLPPELGDLAKLEELRVSYSSVAGLIPEQLGALASLATLELRSNQLMGFVPPAVLALERLAVLRVDDNRLTGKAPEKPGCDIVACENDFDGMVRGVVDEPSPRQDEDVDVVSATYRGDGLEVVFSADGRATCGDSAGTWTAGRGRLDLRFGAAVLPTLLEARDGGWVLAGAGAELEAAAKPPGWLAATARGAKAAGDRLLAKERQRVEQVSKLDVDTVIDLQRENMKLKDQLERLNDRYSTVTREQTTARESSSFLRDKVAVLGKEAEELKRKLARAERDVDRAKREAKAAHLVRTPPDGARRDPRRLPKLGDYACRGYDRGDTSAEARLVRQVEKDVLAKADAARAAADRTPPSTTAARDAALAGLGESFASGAVAEVSDVAGELRSDFSALYKTTQKTDGFAPLNGACDEMAKKVNRRFGPQQLSAKSLAAFDLSAALGGGAFENAEADAHLKPEALAIRNAERARLAAVAFAARSDLRFALGLAQDAKWAKTQFDRELKRIEDAVRHKNGDLVLRTLLCPVKALGAAVRKAHGTYPRGIRPPGKYGGDYARLTDMVRGTVQCETLEAMAAVARELRGSKVFELVRVKNRMSPKVDGRTGGYRDVLTNVSCCGHVCEVAVALNAFLDVAEKKGVHANVDLCRGVAFFDGGAWVGSVDSFFAPAPGLKDPLPASRVARGCVDDLTVFGADLTTRTVDDVPRSEAGFRGLGADPAVADLLSEAACDRLDLRVLRIELCPGKLGPAPAHLGALANLERLELLGGSSKQRMRVDGPFPEAALLKMKKLRVLRLSFLELEGPLPVTVGRLRNLERLEVNGNFLDGKLPGAIASLNNLQRLDVSDNMFTGLLPAKIAAGKKLTRVFVQDNRFHGPIHSAFLSLDEFECGQNRFGQDTEEDADDAAPRPPPSAGAATQKLQLGDGLVPLDASRAKSSSACRGGYAASKAVETGLSYWCTQFGDDFGNPEPVWWSCQVPGGYLLSRLALTFVVDPAAHLVAPSAVTVALRRKGDRPLVAAFSRDDDDDDEETRKGVVTLKFKSDQDLFSEKGDVLKLRATRPGSALGGYVGLQNVSVFGSREADDAADAGGFAVKAPQSSAMFRFDRDANAHGLSVLESADTVCVNGAAEADVDSWAADLVVPRILPSMGRCTLALKLRGGDGFAKSDGIVVGLARGDCDGFKKIADNASAYSFRCRDGAVRRGLTDWDCGFQTLAVPTPEGFYDDGDDVVLEYDRATSSLAVKDSRGFHGVLAADVPPATTEDPLFFFLLTRCKGMGATILESSKIDAGAAPVDLAKNLDIAAKKKKDEARAVADRKRDLRRQRAADAKKEEDRSRRRTVAGARAADGAAAARAALERKRADNEKRRAKENA
ncbi:pyrophosphatase [Aureococcus anophagefferens]|nr:pyrophosphatase [Aureococcus anophagefferens]